EGVGSGARLCEQGNRGGNTRLLLANRNVNAVERTVVLIASRLSRFVQSRLADNGVDTDGRLARRTITDNQLALTAANGNHRVDRHDARLYGLGDRLSPDDPRSHLLDRICDIALDGPLAIHGFAQHVHDPS